MRTSRWPIAAVTGASRRLASRCATSAMRLHISMDRATTGRRFPTVGPGRAVTPWTPFTWPDRLRTRALEARASGAAASVRQLTHRAAERAACKLERTAELAQTLRGSRFPLPLHGRHVLGRDRLLRIQRRPDRQAGSGLGGTSPAVPRRGRPRSARTALRRVRDPRAAAGAGRRILAIARGDAVRPLRSQLGRRRRAEAPRIQRRYADRAARGLRRAVALARGHAPGCRSVQLATRKADRALASDPRRGAGKRNAAFRVRER